MCYYCSSKLWCSFVAIISSNFHSLAVLGSSREKIISPFSQILSSFFLYFLLLAKTIDSVPLVSSLIDLAAKFLNWRWGLGNAQAQTTWQFIKYSRT